jgi:hypothetical protein
LIGSSQPPSKPGSKLQSRRSAWKRADDIGS